MPKIAMINIDAAGHVNPTLPLTAELIRRDADVIYLAPPSCASAIAATGARFRAYDSIFFERRAQDYQRGREEMSASLPLRLAEQAEHVLPQLMDALDEERPDAIIYDRLCAAGGMAAEIRGLPALTFQPNYVANQHVAHPHAQISDAHPLRAEFRQRLEELARRHRFTPRSTAEFLAPIEALNLVFMPRAFHPSGDTFDDRFAFVGPQIPERARPEPFEAPAGDDPLLYVSLGTIFNSWSAFFTICFEAFADRPIRVLASIGDKVDPKAIGPIPKNVRIARSVPQLDVLTEARHFINHGGMNSVQEAIWFGLPMVVVPQNLEQARSARRVQELGLGLALLEHAHVSPAALNGAVTEIDTDPSYRRRVAAMREHSRAAGGHARAADVVLAHLSR